MLYSDYILKAKDLTITYNEEAMVYYLEPDWQTILHVNGLGDLENVKDMYIEGWYDLEDVLKLEVEKRNAVASKKNVITFNERNTDKHERIYGSKSVLRCRRS